MPKGSKKKFICRIFVHTNTTDAEMSKAAGSDKLSEVFFHPKKSYLILAFAVLMKFNSGNRYIELFDCYFSF